MRIKITLTKPTEDVPVNNQEYLNSFFHKILGENNKYHDTFSRYAVSSLQGGRLLEDKRNLAFSENPYFYFSTVDNEMMGIFLRSAMFYKGTFLGMGIKNIVPDDFICHDRFDKIITASPILIKDKGHMLSVVDKEWLERVENNCKAKLAKEGIVDETFSISIISPEKSKRKLIFTKGIGNICSLTRLRIEGRKKTRETLYNMGIGNSTGYGFGSIKIYD